MSALQSSIVAGLVVCVTGCAPGIQLTASGDARRGITFNFSDPAAPRSYRIGHVWAVRQTPEHMWAPVWDISGEQELSSVTWGASYPGLSVDVPPERLQKGKTYEIWIEDWNSGYQSHIMRFTIDAHGKIVELPRTYPETSNQALEPTATRRVITLDDFSAQSAIGPRSR